MKGEDIKKKRNELKLTQTQLAAILGISSRTLINYEQGGVIPDTKTELLQNFIDGNITGDRNIVANQGNAAGGNIVSISLPETGSKKIINADGSIEVTHSQKSEGDELDLKYKILEEQLKSKDQVIQSLQELIKAKDETITILTRNKK